MIFDIECNFFSLSISGDSGENLIQWKRFLICRDFQSSYIKFIFPTAPIQPYTKLNGRVNTNLYNLYVFE